MTSTKKNVMYRATGRRKEAIASIILRPGSGKRVVNGRDFDDYFHSDVQVMVANMPFLVLGNAEEWDVVAKAVGGGISGQMGAVRLAVSRALVEFNEENRLVLRGQGLLTRDSRVVERKKFGHKKARKSFQFSKR